MAFANASHPIKGLRQALFEFLDPTDDTEIIEAMLVPAPTKAEFSEDQEIKKLPGPDVDADKSVNITGGTLVLGWSKLKQAFIAKILGSQLVISGSSPNVECRVKRKTTDVPPYFKYTGRVRYIGKEWPDGDFLKQIYKLSLVGTPKVTNQAGEYATFEATFAVEERSDGEFWDDVTRQTGVELTEDVDNTGPTLSSITPADNATGVGRSDDVVIVFNEAINWNPNNFTLEEIVTPGSAINEVTVEKTISEDLKTVTLHSDTPKAATTAHNVHISGDVRDLKGNYIAAPLNKQFTTGS